MKKLLVASALVGTPAVFAIGWIPTPSVFLVLFWLTSQLQFAYWLGLYVVILLDVLILLQVPQEVAPL